MILNEKEKLLVYFLIEGTKQGKFRWEEQPPIADEVSNRVLRLKSRNIVLLRHHVSVSMRIESKNGCWVAIDGGEIWTLWDLASSSFQSQSQGLDELIDEVKERCGEITD
jgi:hypothetical protein